MAFSSLKSSYFSFFLSFIHSYVHFLALVIFLSVVLLQFLFASLCFALLSLSHFIYHFDLSVCLSYSLHGHSFQMKRKQIRDNVQKYRSVDIDIGTLYVYDVSIARIFVSFCFYHVLRYFLLLLLFIFFLLSSFSFFVSLSLSLCVVQNCVSLQNSLWPIQCDGRTCIDALHLFAFVNNVNGDDELYTGQKEAESEWVNVSNSRLYVNGRKDIYKIFLISFVWMLV